jgi:hypothetical protein
MTLDFVYAPTLPEYGTIAQILQADLAQIRVTLTVQSMDIAALFDPIHGQKYNGLYTLTRCPSWRRYKPSRLGSTTCTGDHSRLICVPESAHVADR